jgi:uncharacterized membrane protein
MTTVRESSNMADALRLDDVLDAAERLSDEEQETLVDVLRKRRAERRREEIAEDVREARREHRDGKTRPMTADELMNEILS